jgi:Tfp pilus assembly protein PilF
MSNHQYESAASHFRYAIVWDSRGVDAHVGLGEVYLKQGKKERALEQFAYVLSIDRHSSAAERDIHEARTEGQEEQAFRDLELQVPREPNNADLHTTYAEELVERDRLSDAVYQATKALDLDPKQWHAHCALGRVELKLGHFAEARSHLQLAIAHDPTDDDALSALGDLDMKEGHADKAVADYRALTKLIPEEAEGHEKLAAALEATGDKTGAAAERKTAADIIARAKSATT